MSTMEKFLLKLFMYLATWIIVFMIHDKKNGKHDIAFAAVAMSLLYYGLYLFSFIEYNNVTTVMGHAVFFAYILFFYVAFLVGLGKQVPTSTADSLRSNGLNIPTPYGWYIAGVLIVFLMYLFVLTKGNPLAVLDIAVELKYSRLELIAQEQDFTLEVLQSVAVSQVIVLIIWSSLTLNQSKFGFWLSFFLAVLQVMSTGSRSPALAFMFIFLSALRFSAEFDSKAAVYYKNIKRYSIYFGFLLIGYMVITTSARSGIEALDIGVFTFFFGVSSYGPLEFLFEKNENPYIFFLATLIIYVSSTIVNFLIRYQMFDESVFTFGYQVFYPYYNLLNKLTGIDFGFLSDIADGSRTRFFVEYSDSATQWSTLFGDFLFSLGPFLGLIVVCLFSYLLGRVVRQSTRVPSLSNIGTSAYAYSFFLMPLVAPTGSLTFHCVILSFIGLHVVRIGRNRVMDMQGQ